MSKTNFLNLSLMELKGKLTKELPLSAESLTLFLQDVSTALVDLEKENKRLKEELERLKRKMD